MATEFILIKNGLEQCTVKKSVIINAQPCLAYFLFKFCGYQIHSCDNSNYRYFFVKLKGNNEFNHRCTVKWFLSPACINHAKYLLTIL